MVNYLRACAPKVKCAFIIIDLDDFKQINDTRAISPRRDPAPHGRSPAELFRASDIIGRFGGDEFVILAKGHEFARKRRAQVPQDTRARAGFAVNGEAMGVTCSLGAVLVNDQNADHDASSGRRTPPSTRPRRTARMPTCCGDTKNTPRSSDP